jgi:hypothetical protein
LLFGIGLTWAQFPDPQPEADDPAVVASRRASAVKAAARIISRRPNSSFCRHEIGAACIEDS